MRNRYSGVAHTTHHRRVVPFHPAPCQQQNLNPCGTSHPPQRRGDEQRPNRRAPMVPPRLDVGEDLGVGDIDDGVGAVVLLVDGHVEAGVRKVMCSFQCN
jgi:hypothetical protein